MPKMVPSPQTFRGPWAVGRAVSARLGIVIGYEAIATPLGFLGRHRVPGNRRQQHVEEDRDADFLPCLVRAEGLPFDTPAGIRSARCPADTFITICLIGKVALFPPGEISRFLDGRVLDPPCPQPENGLSEQPLHDQAKFKVQLPIAKWARRGRSIEST